MNEVELAKTQNDRARIVMGYAFRMTVVVTVGVVLVLVVAGWQNLETQETVSALGVLGAVVGYVHHTSARKHLAESGPLQK